MTQTTQNQDKDSREPARAPDWTVKAPYRGNRKEGLERIGAAWNRGDGCICVRLIGTQIVTSDLYLYPLGDDENRG